MNDKKYSLAHTLVKLQSPSDHWDLMTDAMIRRLASPRFEIPKPVLEAIRKNFGKNYLINNISEIYALHFSEEELMKMLEFWSSPVGKSLKGDTLVHKIRDFPTRWTKEINDFLRLNNINTEEPLL